MNYGYVTVIGKLNKYYIDKKTKEKHYNYYLVEFEDGYITETECRALKHGKIKNPNIPSVYNVGYIGVGENNSGNSKKHTKEYETWKKMLQRCYDANYQKFEPSYIGTTVDKRWHNFQNFCEDIKSLPNYNKWIVSSEYELDKDILCNQYNINPKIYSKKTCMFIKKKFNSIFKSHNVFRDYIGIRIEDGYTEHFVCFADFARKWDLNSATISGCINGRYKKHKGWIFKIGGKENE